MGYDISYLCPVRKIAERTSQYENQFKRFKMKKVITIKLSNGMILKKIHLAVNVCDKNEQFVYTFVSLSIFFQSLFIHALLDENS